MLQKLFLYMIMYTDNLYCLLKNNHLTHAIIPSTVVFKTRKYGIIDRLYTSSLKKLHGQHLSVGVNLLNKTVSC